jgi:hypothetical protein
MKTATEKAKELVDTFKATTILKSDILNEAAKSCALICCDEILNIQVVKNGYWQQVKTEIEKL